MRILLTVPSLSEGSGLSVYVENVASFLCCDDNEVAVLTTHSTDGLQERMLLDRKNKAIGLFTVKSRLNILRRYQQTLCHIRRFAPDVLINNYDGTVQFLLSMIGRRTKVIHVIHNNTSDFYRVASINGWRVDRWIAPTPALAAYFNEYTNQSFANRVTVIPHGVELPLAKPRREASSTVQLAFVGVLYEHKGVRILPEIIKRLADAHYDFHFTVIGDGILREELQQHLCEQISDGTVEFTGRITSREVYERLSTTDIFVYPTHIDAFGLVIAEAMINGVVPIVTLLPGITDSIVDDGRSGYLVGQDDVEGFVDRIIKLIDNPDHRSRMSVEAADKAMRCFTLDTMKANYLDCINQLTNQ